MTTKRLSLAVLVVALLTFSITFFHRATAQTETPLDELALVPEDIPNSENAIVLNEGYKTSRDTNHPLHPQNSEDFLLHQYLEAYGIVIITDQYQVGHHLYRYNSADQAREQAEAIWQEAFRAERQEVLKTENVDIATGSTGNFRGRSLRVTDPETGGVYYWFIGTQDRTLIMLMVGGLDHKDTLDAFEEIRTSIEANATRE